MDVWIVVATWLSVPLTHCAGSVDFQDLNEVVIFEPESSRVCTQIIIIEDQISEPIECFLVGVTSQQDDRNISVAVSNATVCIVDNGMIVYCSQMY